MRETFVEFRGYLLGMPPDLATGSIPYVRQNFTFVHDTTDELGTFINKAIQEISRLGGMIVHKKEPHKQYDWNNMAFVPMHMISSIEPYVKPIATPLFDQQDSLPPEEEKPERKQ